MGIQYIQVVPGPLSTTTTKQRFGVDKGNVGINSDAANSYRIGYNQNGTIVYLADDGGSGPARLPVINSKAYAMGNAAAAISMFSVTLATLQGAGGVLWYSYVSTNGTDVASLTGMVTYALVDKAGTTTGTITEVAGNQAKAVSAGNTITIAWTATTGSNIVTFKAATTDSMTTTSANLVYTLLPLSGTVVTL